MRVRAVSMISLVLLVTVWCPAANADVAESKHDFSAEGGSGAKICVFCHTPHVAASAIPEWNRSEAEILYTPYWSPTLQAVVGQPTGTSKICLSCHDGTIALSSVRSPGGESFGPYPLSERANLTSDLSDDHPVSFVYDEALAARDDELVSPESLPREIWLDADRQMQCTSCHDPHSTDLPRFLAFENSYSQLCVTCHHLQGWEQSAHANSTADWDGSGVNPWPYSDETTVAANGCGSCHTPHGAGIPESLLVFPREEENCIACHNGSTARTDIAAELRKLSVHPVDRFQGLHEGVEDPASMPRHVECHDCHDPHTVFAGAAGAPAISPLLEGVPGVTSSGANVALARYEYEVCFRCHADGADVPAPYIERQIPQPSIRLKVDPANPSYHPIEEIGQNIDVPSLLFPLNPTSTIACTDCHTGNAGTAPSGVRGPHGSIWPFLLEQQYSVSDGTGESYQSYAMCYKCHDREVILGDVSFSAHRVHIVEDTTPCSVCHDPHGISGTQGTMVNNSHLINFDVSIVEPDPVSGLLMFEDLGSNQGRCTLMCHGTRHGPPGTPEEPYEYPAP